MGHYVLRPMWQRAAFTATNLVAGIGLAAVLLGGRSRIVRKMFIIPNTAASSSPSQRAADRLLVIQSPLHPRDHGVVYPLKRTGLVQSSDNAEMLVTLKDDRGHYSVGLQGALVGGEKRATVWDARKALFVGWYGEKRGTQMFLDSSKVENHQ